MGDDYCVEYYHILVIQHPKKFEDVSALDVGKLKEALVV